MYTEKTELSSRRLLYRYDKKRGFFTKQRTLSFYFHLCGNSPRNYSPNESSVTLNVREKNQNTTNLALKRDGPDS